MTQDVYKQRALRERKARLAAEALLEAKSRDLYLANQRLEIRSGELQAILENVPAGIAVVNSDCTIKLINKPGARMFGYTLATDLVGQDILSLFDTESAPILRSLISQACERQNKGSAQALPEVKAIRMGSDMFPAEVDIVQTEAADRSIWICRDISRRKQAESERQALEQERRHLQKMESLGTLASGIAHEINTPVQYVSDNVRFLQDTITDLFELIDRLQPFFGTDPIAETTPPMIAAARDKAEEIDLDFLHEEAPGALEQTLSGLQQISKIVTAIKEFSHPGSQETSDIDLNHAIETTATVSRNQWKYVSTLDLKLTPDLPSALCHAGDFNQVLLNLIVNAADAIEENKAEGELGAIEISTYADKGTIWVKVTDDGGGIPEENLGRIFDPFFTTKAVGKGSGQGLAIAYNLIVNRYHGQLIVDSEPGIGTTFIIGLPCAESDGE